MGKSPLDIIKNNRDEHVRVFEDFFARYADDICEIAELVTECIKSGGKILFCGNGGSACDSMHIAGEFVGRFRMERKGLAAIALSADSGIITAVGNDYGFDNIFSRQIEALANKGDILIAMSTSGKSPNIISAFAEARNHGVKTILLTGDKGKHNKDADITLAVSGVNTARIQEVHMAFLHILAEIVEENLFSGSNL